MAFRLTEHKCGLVSPYASSRQFAEQAEVARVGSGKGDVVVARKARAVLDHPPPLQGWRTTDEEEIALRRWRGRSEIVTIEALEADHPFFGTFRAQSGSGAFYEVEIRSLDGFANSCGCIDHRVNGLGTSKHIEGVLAALRQRGAKAFRQATARGSPRIEVFLDRREAGQCRRWCRPPRAMAGHMSKARGWLA